jgi:hypothetical protein
VVLLCLWPRGRQGMLPLAWAASLWLVVCARPAFVEAAVMGLRMKILPDLVGADNGVAFGRRFPS